MYFEIEQDLSFAAIKVVSYVYLEKVCDASDQFALLKFDVLLPVLVKEADALEDVLIWLV